jgi:hypothetical protein
VHVSSNVVETHFKNISYTLYDENMQILNKTTFNLLVPNINFSVSGENNSYFYDILVYDWAGNFKVSNLRKINLIDVTNPTLTIVSPQNKTYSYNEGIRLDYNAFDPHLDSCWYNLDGGENISLANCQNSVLNVEDESSHTLELFVNDTLGYMNSSSVTFFVNSSLIETPTYKILRGTTFVDGYSEETIEVTDMSKSFILHTSRSADSGPDSLQVIGDFVNSNKVSFENYDSGESAIVDWSIISGPDIKVQRGEIEFSNEKNLSSQINSVNLSNSFIIVNSKLNTGDASKNTDGFFISKFLDNSTIYFERGSNYSSGVLSWQVVSWSSANVQSGNSNILSGSVESGNVLIDSVNLNNSFLIFSKNIVGDNSVGDSMIEGKMVDNSNIEFNRRLNGGNVSLEFFVVSSELFNVQSGTYTHLLNSDEQTIGLDNDLVDIQRSFDIHSNENDGIATSFASAFVTQNILDTQNLVLQKGLGSGAGETSWFAVEILDVSNPVVNLNSPINNYNYSSHNLGQFSFVVEDETNISNCSLWGSWNGGWHLNQTISDVSKEVTNYFDSFSVNESGFYSWKVVCRDVYANSGESLNYTFSSYLPPSEPEFVNITQSSNDGLGNITLDWEESNDTVKYKIYAGEDLNNLVLIDEVNQSNYTDSSFAGQKRKFYRIEAWNPSAVNMTNYIFGAHVYELKQNQSSEYSIKNRNWIGFPTNYLGIEKAKDVLDEVDAITTMTRLNPVTQKRVSCTEFSCPESYACTETACNFDLQAGEGYEVLLNESGEENLNWSAVGLVQEPVQITLVYNENGAVFNNNWISMYAGTVLEDASDLSGSLLGEDAITSWNIDEQKSEGWNYVCLPWNPAVCFWMGEDFKINPEGAYEVSVTQDSMWTQI